MRDIAPVVERTQFRLEPAAFLAKLAQRGLDGLDLLAAGRKLAAGFGALATVFTAFVLGAWFGSCRRGGGAGALLEPAGVVLQVAVEVAHRTVGHQPELVTD